MLLSVRRTESYKLFLVIMTVSVAACCVMEICKCEFFTTYLTISTRFLTETYDTRLLLEYMSRSCNKEQLLVFIVRQSIPFKHAILHLTDMGKRERFPSAIYISSVVLTGRVGGDSVIKH